MTFGFFGAKPLSKPMVAYSQMDQNITFLPEGSFENVVCKMVAILCRRRCDNISYGEISGSRQPEIYNELTR